MMRNLSIIILFAAALTGCGDDNTSEFTGDDNYLVSLTLTTGGIEFPASISGGTVSVHVPEGILLDGTTAMYTISENATCDPDLSTYTGWDSDFGFEVVSYTGSTRPYSYRIERIKAANIWQGSVTLPNQEAVEEFGARRIEVITGNLSIGGTSSADPVTSLAPLAGLLEVHNSITFNSGFRATDLAGLEELRTVGDITLGYNSTVTEVSLPSLVTIGGSLTVASASQVVSITLPVLETVAQEFRLSSLGNLERLYAPRLKTVGDGFTLASCPRLTDIDLSSLEGYDF